MDQGKLINEFIELLNKYYESELHEIIRLKQSSIIVDFEILSKFSFDLVDVLLEDPQETLKAFGLAIKESFDNVDHNIFVRIKNLPKTEYIPIRNIRCKHIEKLFVIEGNVKNRSVIKPQVTEAKFECPSCGNIIKILQVNNNYIEPTNCGCGRKGNFISLPDKKMDIQYLSIEEPFDQLEEDSVPQRIRVLLKHDLTDPSEQKKYIPGKPIRITGVLKEVPIFNRGKKQTELDYIFETNHCESLEDDLTKTSFTEEEIQNFIELSKDPDIYKKLISSVAPHISGHKKVKEAMLLFLVKGVSKESKDGKRTREYFNVLLMGDPGAAKSQLGNEIDLLSWRSRKVVGKGASGPGLTASAERDEILNMRILSAGAIPLCNEGHVIIDEVDKMEKEVQSHLHESMEDGTITINKSQIQGQLKARTAVFMIGNPKFGRYDNYKTVIEQIELPKALINRFDLIFPIKDIPDPEKDIELADAILYKHLDIDGATKREIPLQLLKNYICYASLNIKPKMTKEASLPLKDLFIKLRGNKSEGNIGITGRQLDGLVRLAEASAKLHLRNEVTIEDVNKAIELLTYSLKAFGVDPKTGKIDIDRITTGYTASQRSEISQLMKILKELDGDKPKMIKMESILIKTSEIGINDERTLELIDKLKQTGDIMGVGKKHIQRI